MLLCPHQTGSFLLGVSGSRELGWKERGRMRASKFTDVQKASEPARPASQHHGLQAFLAECPLPIDGNRD